MRNFYSSIIPLLYFFSCEAPRFDAHLSPGPDIPDGPPDHVHVQGLNKVTHDLLGLTQVAELDFPDLLVTDASEEVVTWGLVRAMCRPTISVLPEITCIPKLLLDSLE